MAPNGDQDFSPRKHRWTRHALRKRVERNATQSSCQSQDLETFSAIVLRTDWNSPCWKMSRKLHVPLIYHRVCVKIKVMDHKETLTYDDPYRICKRRSEKDQETKLGLKEKAKWFDLRLSPKSQDSSSSSSWCNKSFRTGLITIKSPIKLDGSASSLLHMIASSSFW